MKNKLSWYIWGVVVGVLLTFCFMLPWCSADQIKIQYRYDRYLYQCPCGNEFIETSRFQKYTCPICKAVLGEGQYKSVGDTLYFDTLPKQSVIDAQIQARIDKAIEQIKHPPIAVEPTYIQELNLYKEMTMSATQQMNRVLEKATDITKLEELKGMVSDLSAKDQIDNKIVELKTK
jgi:hypothetical protein